jgi:hypothetical protein
VGKRAKLVSGFDGRLFGIQNLKAWEYPGELDTDKGFLIEQLRVWI